MTTTPVEVVYGTGFFGNAEPWISDKDLAATYELLEKYNVKKLDSAQLYGESEKRLGETQAGKRFSIDTKWQCGWSPGSANKDNILASGKDSVKKIGTQVSNFIPVFMSLNAHLNLAGLGREAISLSSSESP